MRNYVTCNICERLEEENTARGDCYCSISGAPIDDDELTEPTKCTDFKMMW